MSNTIDLRTAEGRAEARRIGLAVPDEVTARLEAQAAAKLASDTLTHLAEDMGMTVERRQLRPSNWGCWCLWLPRRTATVNELMRGVKARIRLKKADRELVRSAAVAAGIPPPSGKRRVRILLVCGPGRRRPDPDAIQKSLGDALVQCGALRQDSPDWVTWMPVDYARGETDETFVVLEDVA